MHSILQDYHPGQLFQLLDNMPPMNQEDMDMIAEVDKTDKARIEKEKIKSNRAEAE